MIYNNHCFLLFFHFRGGSLAVAVYLNWGNLLSCAASQGRIRVRFMCLILLGQGVTQDTFLSRRQQRGEYRTAKTFKAWTPAGPLSLLLTPYWSDIDGQGCVLCLQEEELRSQMEKGRDTGGGNGSGWMIYTPFWLVSGIANSWNWHLSYYRIEWLLWNSSIENLGVIILKGCGKWQNKSSWSFLQLLYLLNSFLIILFLTNLLDSWNVNNCQLVIHRIIHLHKVRGIQLVTSNHTYTYSEWLWRL